MVPVLPHCFSLKEGDSVVTGQPIILIHSEDQLGDSNTLLPVTNDWLLWQRRRNAGQPIFYAGQVLPEVNFDALSREIFTKGYEWTMVRGEDVTVIEGVSLGRRLARLVSNYIADYERITAMVNGVLERLQPSLVRFVEFRSDIPSLDQDEIFSIICALAGARGIAVEDVRSTATKVQKPPAKPVQPRQSRPLQAVFSWTLGVLSAARGLLAPNRPRALLICTHLNTSPLLEAFAGGKIFPVVLADWYPNKKNVGALLRRLAAGVLLVSARGRLSPGDGRRVDLIVECIRDHWRNCPAIDDRETRIRNFVEREFFSCRRLHAVAADVAHARAILDHANPKVVLTDGLQDPFTNILLDLAGQRGIQRVITWHAPHIGFSRIPALVFDHAPPLVDHVFSWGEQMERWLETIGSSVRTVRTGSPIAEQRCALAPRPAGGSSVLLLQYATPIADFASRAANQYEYFVTLARRLSAGGLDVTLKVHPGQDVLDYYTRIAVYFGIQCHMARFGNLGDYLEAADVVIGPVVSGSMLESIASGRPFVPVLLSPHSLFADHFLPDETFDIAGAADVVLSKKYPDNSRILSYFLSIDQTRSAGVRIWNQLEALTLGGTTGDQQG